MISAGTSASDARNTAADMNARNTAAADTNAASPAALQLASKGKKGAVAKGQSAGAAAESKKGPSSFGHLLTAKLAGKNHDAPQKDLLAVGKTAGAGAATLLAGAESGKLAGGVSKAAKDAAGKLVLKLAAGPATQVKPSLSGSEEAEGKKKPAPAHGKTTHAGALEALLLVPAQNGTAAISGEKTAHAKDSGQAVGNAQGAHAGARAVAAHQAEPKIHVVDLRKKAEIARTAGEAAAALKSQQGLSADKDASASLSPRPVTIHDAAGNVSFKQVPPAVPAGQTPLERFREMAGGELVKASNMVLRDGGGEIRLVLKPESLGSVRIKMHLVDNSIEGRIIVDSPQVKQVIDGNMDALMRAFRAEGFQGASLQVSVGGQNADNGRQEQDERPEAVRRVTAQDFERNIPGIENLSMGDLLVNLFV
jgi:flagellar hook-length control protein FliK